MAEHTPGPWAIDGNNRLDVTANDYGTVATVLAPTTPAGQANARLIAAGPDLLAALEKIEALKVGGPHTSAKAGFAALAVVGQARVIARTAIAQVRGTEGA